MMWSIYVTIPCALEKNIYSTIVGWSILQTSVRPDWMSCGSSRSLRVFCLSVPSITKARAHVSDSYCKFVFYLFHFFQVLFCVFWSSVVRWLLGELTLLSWCESSLSPVTVFTLKSVLCDTNHFGFVFWFLHIFVV